MLIDTPGFVSMNSLADCPPGRYTIVESIYDSPRIPASEAALGALDPLQFLDCEAVLSELVPEGRKSAIGADLQLVLGDGTVLFRDFQVVPDGGWRDSYGAKADSLAGLLPPELSNFTLRQRQGLVVEHDGMGRIVPVYPAEANHGS
jgi:hypothetical protein